jgi:hypothetical protein
MLDHIRRVQCDSPSGGDGAEHATPAVDRNVEPLAKRSERKRRYFERAGVSIESNALRVSRSRAKQRQSLSGGRNRNPATLTNGMCKRARGENSFAEIGGREEEDGSHLGAIGAINVNAKSTKRLRGRPARPK